MYVGKNEDNIFLTVTLIFAHLSIFLKYVALPSYSIHQLALPCSLKWENINPTWKYIIFLEKQLSSNFSHLPSIFCCTSWQKTFSLVWHSTWRVEKNSIQSHVGKNEDKNYLTFTLILTHLLIFSIYVALTLTFQTHSISKVWNFMAQWFTNEKLPSKQSKKSKKCQKCNVSFGLKLS